MNIISPITANPVAQITNLAGLNADGDTLVLPTWYRVLGLAGAAIGAYHGYKRNNSVGWAIGWSLLGGIAPVIVIPVAFAQGIDKEKPKSKPMAGLRSFKQMRSRRKGR